LEAPKKIYFASDLHLGAPDAERSLHRERHFVRWLDRIKGDAAELYLLGDVFDFWFEYHKAVPKGFVRILGKLAELADKGIVIHYFVGNHDMWMRQYFKEQFGASIHFHPVLRVIGGKTYYIGHGDGLGPGDRSYKVLKRLFRNRLAQWAFHRLHPNFGIGVANYFSRKSRRKTGHMDAIDHGENEYLLRYARKTLEENTEIDYFVFGHRHLPKFQALENGKAYINLGDWITHFSYLQVDAFGPHLYRFTLDGDMVPIFPVGAS
jgi:UDP-2,3-diacylglucosamine hydrolase